MVEDEAAVVSEVDYLVVCLRSADEDSADVASGCVGVVWDSVDGDLSGAGVYSAEDG